MREPVTEKEIREVLKEAKEIWRQKLKEKGPGIFVSRHEILGVLEEEYMEFKDDVIANNGIESELEDMLVVILHGLASLKTKKMDW